MHLLHFAISNKFEIHRKGKKATDNTEQGKKWEKRKEKCEGNKKLSVLDERGLTMAKGGGYG